MTLKFAMTEIETAQPGGPGWKTCSMCGKFLLLGHFAKDGGGRRRAACMACRNDRRKHPRMPQAPAPLLGAALVSPLLPWSGLRLALYGCPQLRGIKPRRCGPGAVWRWSLGWQPAICRSIASDKARAGRSSCRASGKGCACAA